MLVLDASPLSSPCISSGRGVLPKAPLPDLCFGHSAFTGNRLKVHSQYVRCQMQQGASWIGCSLSQRNIADQGRRSLEWHLDA